MKDPETRRLTPPSLQQFREFVRKIISVPKAEIDKEEKTHRQRRKRQKQKRA